LLINGDLKADGLMTNFRVERGVQGESSEGFFRRYAALALGDPNTVG
jgi:hypothetical protein